jgi:hypothetical protein
MENKLAPNANDTVQVTEMKSGDIDPLVCLCKCWNNTISSNMTSNAVYFLFQL